MILREAVLLALEALWANKLRSFLTMLGVIIGVAAVIAVVAIARGAQSLVLAEFDSLGSGMLWVQPNWREHGAMARMPTLAFRDLSDIRALAGVAAASPEISTQAEVRTLRKAERVTVFGVGEHYLDVRRLQVTRGRFLGEADLSAALRVAVLGGELKEKLFGGGEAIGQAVRINGVPYTVVGVLEKAGGLLGQMGPSLGRGAFIPYTTIRRVSGEDRFSVVFIQPVGPERAEGVRSSVRDLVDRRYGEGRFQVESLDQMLGAFRRVSDILAGVVGGIAGIALLVGGVGIMNIMLVSVAERTREIGIRKALGARRRDILRQFLVEAVVISLVGGGIGLGVGTALAAGVGRLLDLPPLVTGTTVVLAVAVSVGVGILFGVYPASRAARLNPVEALRYE